MAGPAGRTAREFEPHTRKVLARRPWRVAKVRFLVGDLDPTEAHGFRIRAMHARGVSTACGRVAPVKGEQPLAVMHVTIFFLATSPDFFRIE